MSKDDTVFVSWNTGIANSKAAWGLDVWSYFYVSYCLVWVKVLRWADPQSKKSYQMFKESIPNHNNPQGLIRKGWKTNIPWIPAFKFTHIGHCYTRRGAVSALRLINHSGCCCWSSGKSSAHPNLTASLFNFVANKVLH